MFVKTNLNPCRARVGDCTVRAIACATGKSWERVYIGMCLEGFVLGDMPSANHVWGAYLRRQGFKRRIVDDGRPDDGGAEEYTVADFAKDHPEGTYILAISGHVVCVRDGDWMDTWDSGGETPVYYWTKEEREAN